MNQQVDYVQLATSATNIMRQLCVGNAKVNGFFDTDEGYRLVLGSIYKAAELASKRIRNIQKSREFAIWFANEYENMTYSKAPDKVVNLAREVSVSFLTPYKTSFFDQ